MKANVGNKMHLPKYCEIKRGFTWWGIYTSKDESSH